jgi:rubrerythrin
MAVSDKVEQQADFQEGIDKWMELEDVTIAHCDKILDATDNRLVEIIVDSIRADSEKHKVILSFITEALNVTITLEPDELGELSVLLDEHLEIEKSSIDMALREYDNSRHFVIRHLLSYLLADEKKHFKLLGQLKDFQRQLYPYA